MFKFTTIIERFSMSVESNFPIALVLHCFAATLCDWLKNLAQLYQPIRSKTKTNRDVLVRVFPRLAPATCICFEFRLSASVMIGHSEYFDFGFGFTSLDNRSKIQKYKKLVKTHKNLKEPLQFRLPFMICLLSGPLHCCLYEGEKQSSHRGYLSLI